MIGYVVFDYGDANVLGVFLSRKGAEDFIKEFIEGIEIDVTDIVIFSKEILP